MADLQKKGKLLLFLQTAKRLLFMFGGDSMEQAKNPPLVWFECNATETRARRNILFQLREALKKSKWHKRITRLGTSSQLACWCLLSLLSFMGLILRLVTFPRHLGQRESALWRAVGTERQKAVQNPSWIQQAPQQSHYLGVVVFWWLLAFSCSGRQSWPCSILKFQLESTEYK